MHFCTWVYISIYIIIFVIIIYSIYYILQAILLIVIIVSTIVIDQAYQFQDRLTHGVEYKSFHTVAVWALVSANVAFIYESIFIMPARLLNFQWMSKGHIPAVTVVSLFEVYIF